MSTSRNRVSLLVAGDIAITNSLSKFFIDEKLVELVKSHDFRVANWEAPIIESDFKKINKAGPHIYQNKSYENLLKKDLFNVFSLANNHIMDYGVDGLKKTLSELSNSYCTGAGNTFEETYKPLILVKDGLKIAFLACGESQFGCVKSKEESLGYAWVNSNEISKQILKLKSEVDFLIVLPHAGLEMEDLPLPEWRLCYQNFIDLGTDMVIASHPHVIQPKEVYKGKQIYYSLGNFLFNTNSKDERWHNSLMLSINLEKGTSKSIIIEEHFVQNKNETLHLNDDYKSKFEELNKTLAGEHNVYLSEINKICLRCWEDYYEDYYFYERDMFSQFKSKYIRNRYFKYILKRILKHQRRNNQVLLYHNISIETHRYVVERALKILNKINY